MGLSKALKTFIIQHSKKFLFFQVTEYTPMNSQNSNATHNSLAATMFVSTPSVRFLISGLRVPSSSLISMMIFPDFGLFKSLPAQCLPSSSSSTRVTRRAKSPSSSLKRKSARRSEPRGTKSADLHKPQPPSAQAVC